MKLVIAIVALSIGLPLHAQDVFAHEHTSQSYASVAVNSKEQVLVPTSVEERAGNNFGTNLKGNAATANTRTEIDSVNPGEVGGAITGTILDSMSKKPIVGVEVSLKGTHIGTRTNRDGKFTLANIKPGPYMVSFRLLGYKGTSRSVTINADQVVDGNITLASVSTQLNRVVVTGTITGMQEKTLPNAITVISAEDIERRGITSIEQLFRGAVPGMVALNTGSVNDDNKVQMYSRGGTYVDPGVPVYQATPPKTYVDGVQVSDPSYMNRIDVNSIDHIEILTGPQASTIYGSNSLNGVIQIFTKRGSENPLQVEGRILGGTIQSSYAPGQTGQYDVSARVSGTQSGTSYFGGFASKYTGPWLPKQTYNYYSGTGGLHQQTALLTFDGSGSVSQSVQGGGNGVSYDASKQLASLMQSGLSRYNPFVYLVSDFETRIQQRHFAGTIGYTPFAWLQTQLTVGNDQLDNTSTQRHPVYATPDDTLNTFENQTESTTLITYNATLRAPVGSLGQITVTGGFDGSNYTSSTVQGSGFNITGSANGSGSSAFFAPQVSRSRGGYVQSQLAINDLIFFTYGLRGEYNSTYGGKYGISYTPRYGVSILNSFGSLTTKVRASYGAGTRPPTRRQLGPFYDVFLPSGQLYIGTLPAQQLGPESQKGYDAGIELYLGSRASLSVTHYDQKIHDLIEALIVDSIFSPQQTYQPLFRYYNVGEIKNDGWEGTGTWNAGPISLQGTYSSTMSRVVKINPDIASYRLGSSTYLKPGSTLQYLPAHTWSGDIGYAVAKSSVHLLTYGIGRSIVGAPQPTQLRNTTEQQNTGNNSERNLLAIAPSYTTTNLRLTQQINQKVQAIVQVDNLSNEYVNDFTGKGQMIYPAIGRTGLFGVNFRW